MIYSGWSLASIQEYLQQYGGAKYLRIIYDFRTSKDTNRTLAVLDEEVYGLLVCNGVDKRPGGKDFSISRYILRDSQLPGKDKITKLFIQVPPVFRHRESFVRNSLEEKLHQLAEWNIIPANSWILTIPLQSRETGILRGGCYVSFKDVSPQAIALVKICINDTCWDKNKTDPLGEVVRCFWARSAPAKSQTGKFGPRPE